MKYIGVFLVLLLIPFTFAANIEYDIQEKKTFVSMSFEEVGYFNIELPNDFTELTINSDDYVLDDNYLIINGDGATNIRFSSKSFIEKTSQGSLFISKDSNHLLSNVKVIIPEGNSLMEDKIIFPKEYSLSTDGKRIIIEWNNLDKEEILLSYSGKSSLNFYYYIIAALFFVSIIYYQNHKKKREDKTQNLFREEKKIMKYLVKKKECWTKEMVRDLGISKVKLSRKLRSLEEKGLIERIPHGNENRIKLK